MEVVLKRSTCQQETIGGTKLPHNFRQLCKSKVTMVTDQGELRIQYTTYLGFLILDPVCLINDNVSPVELLEGGLLFEHHLVGGDHNVPLPRHDLLTDDTMLGGERVTQ